VFVKECASVALVVLQGGSRKLFFLKEEDEDGNTISRLALRVQGHACGAGGVEEYTAPLSTEVIERVIDKALPLYEKYGWCTEYEKSVVQTEGNRVESLHKRYMRTAKGCKNRNSFTALRFMLTEGMFAANVGCSCSLEKVYGAEPCRICEGLLESVVLWKRKVIHDVELRVDALGERHVMDEHAG
jgi:hypothetical protein